MAELPDVGKNCALNSCNKLDFTPYLCKKCEGYYCSDHRFIHGCDDTKQYDEKQGSSNCAPVRPFICSKEGCSNAESIKIVCSLCLLNFCLKHRHEDEHCCAHIPKNKKEEVAEKMAVIREACGVHSEEFSSRAVNVEHPKKNIKLTDAQKAKMDKVALMKLKLNNKSDLGPNEQLIIFVEWANGREPILIGKSWTLGRAISCFTKKHTEFSGVLSVYHVELGKQLDYSDLCGQVLNEQDTVFVENS